MSNTWWLLNINWTMLCICQQKHRHLPKQPDECSQEHWSSAAEMCLANICWVEDLHMLVSYLQDGPRITLVTMYIYPWYWFINLIPYISLHILILLSQKYYSNSKLVWSRSFLVCRSPPYKIKPLKLETKLDFYGKRVW